MREAVGEKKKAPGQGSGEERASHVGRASDGCGEHRI